MLTAAPDMWSMVVMGVTPFSPRGSVHHMGFYYRLSFHLWYKAYPLLIHDMPCKPRKMLLVKNY